MSDSKTKLFSGPPQIDPHEIQLGEKIGEGCFGTVYVGRCRATDVAIKVPKKQEMTPEQLDAFCKEVEIMSNIYAPNINLFMGACTIPGKIMIVTELLEGDLESIFRNPNYPISLYERLKMTRDAAQGIAWLHGSNPVIIHRDLKTSNLLFDKNKRIKVCDFGFSQLFQRGKKMVDEEGAKGTPLYMAPEVMLGDAFNEKADVYSFGIVLWEALTRLEPFSHHSDFDAFVEAVCVNNERPPIPEDCLPSLRRLITQCWAANPAVRPSFPVIVDALENIIIECAIDDDVGRVIWKKYFLRKDQVLWLEEFVPVVAQFIGHALPNPNKNEDAFLRELQKLLGLKHWKCLQAVLADKKDGDLVVNLEKFGQVLAWFGPFKDPDSQMRFFDRVQQTLQHRWFHGNVEYEEAVNHLADKNPGTFLVRFSSKDHPGCFTISKVNKQRRIIHHRIMHKPGTNFTSSDGKFSASTLQDLVEKSTPLFLTDACPGSPYSYIFLDNPHETEALYRDTPEDDDEY